MKHSLLALIVLAFLLVAPPATHSGAQPFESPPHRPTPASGAPDPVSHIDPRTGYNSATVTPTPAATAAPTPPVKVNGDSWWMPRWKIERLQ